MSFSAAVLRIRDFRLVLGTRIFILMGWMAQDVIIGWQVYAITKDPFMLGLAGLTEALPALACALFAGHVVDTNKPHRVFCICLAMLTINALTLCIIGGGHAGFTDNTIVISLFVGIFISGIVRSFTMPAMFTLLPQIVPRKDLAAGSAWFSSGFQMAAVTGPAVAGLVYGGYGETVAWVLPVSMFSIALVLMLNLGAHAKRYQSDQPREKTMKSIKAGWRFLLTNRILLSVMLLDMFAVLFGGAVAMLPAFASEVLNVGAEELGMLRAAPAIGAIVTALYLALRPMRTIKATTLLIVVAAFGMCIIGFGLSETFSAALFFLALAGAFDSVSVVVRGTMMQVLTPDAMRGRVASVNSMFIISSNEIGAFESGVAAKLMGLVPSIIFGGAMTLLVVAATAAFSPKFRRTTIDTLHGTVSQKKAP